MPDLNFEEARSAQLQSDNINAEHGSELNYSGKEKDSLVAAIALRIRQSLDLELILQQTVAEVRQFLNTDRVFVYRFEPDFSGVIAVESAAASTLSVFGHKLNDPCLAKGHIREKYKQGKVHLIDDLTQTQFDPCYHDVLNKFKVKANLVVPIVANDKLWGLLIAHHCQSPRQWQSSEVELLKQLAIQVGIAVQQAELYDRVQSFNVYLEQKIARRTAILQSSVKFETLTRKITEKIRDSLDEPQILQTVTQEIGQVLQIERCKIELYNSDRSTVQVAYEYGNMLPNPQNAFGKVADFPELYRQLLQKQSLQFVEHVPELNLPEVATRLVCPIFDDRGVLGNLWLLRPKEEHFTLAEIILVEQVANQCAIAIRQARLYQQSQIQVEELARLNLLKDDFLKTISHELKTPMSSILLASETLEVLLEKEIGSQRSVTFTKVLDIFRSACDRQNQLVNDLLTLCYIDARKEIMTMQWIDLSVWLPQIIEPFIARIEQQQQTLEIDLEPNLPQFKSDISSIKRILVELLNNACKYTPAGETIRLQAKATERQIEIGVHNTGVEIPCQEQQRVFDKFYRIPRRDPWRFGGTGMGLALVKHLVESLGGKIYLVSQMSETAFMLDFPHEPDDETEG